MEELRSSVLVVQLRMLDVQARTGKGTRERILELAEAAVLDKGFAATSIDELVAAASISKSGFFYHFKDKSELALALLRRYLDQEGELLDDLFGRAKSLNEDPLHGFLVGLKMLADVLNDLPNGHPGCLVASFCYQDQLFNKSVRDLNAAGVLGWRRRFRTQFDEIAARYPPRIEVNLDDLADMASALVDGGIILSKVVKDKTVLPRQVMLYREFVRGIFLGTTPS